MQYFIDYELCALFFLVIVVIQFLRKPRFPSSANKMFGLILLSTVVVLVLDLVSAKTIEYAAFVPMPFNLTVDYACYALQIAFPVLLPLYVLTITGRLNLKKPIQLLMLTPAIFCLIVLCSNPWTGAFFYFDENLNYFRGPCRVYLFIQGFLYFAVNLIILRINRNRVQKYQYKTIISFILIVTAAMLIQVRYPRYLISGAAIALAVTMTYFTLQNPEEMLESVSGVFNYAALLQFLQNLLDEGKNFQLVAVDVDGIKRINSMFGLNAGNEAIGQIGAFLASGKERPWVFRMMGTSFVAIVHSEAGYRSLLDRVESRFQQTWRIMGSDLMISARLRHFSNAGFLKSSGDVISLLETALYDQPQNVKPGLCLEIDQSMLEAMHRQLAVETALREALESGKGFSIYLQPIYSLEKKTFTMAEVLLRFRHPVLGEISPGEFIPIAEKKGLAAKIDEYVIAEAYRFIRKYRLHKRFGLESIEINLSAAGILQQNLPWRLFEMGRKYGIPPDFLLFEVTETAATITNDVLAGCMDEMLKHGFRFVLDDFGAGYANITQVVNLPFYAVKLDRTLLSRNNTEETNDVVFKDMLFMLKRLHMVTVVEGVETREQLDRVIELRADYVQGFYYSHPLPAEEYIDFLSRCESKEETAKPMAPQPGICE